MPEQLQLRLDPQTAHWPTAEIPDAPVSVETHGEVKGWTRKERAAFRKWARSLEAYGPPPKAKKKRNA